MAKLPDGLLLKSLTGTTYTVKRFIASGSQGSVYEVANGSQSFALKWYSNGNNVLKSHFRELLQYGTPKCKDNRPDERFIWPEDLVDYNGGFGYIMDFVDMSQYTTLFKLITINSLYPTLDVLCTICREMADAFDNLHTRGLCYKDLSHNNILINNRTGEIRIFDVDNVCVSGAKGSIAGTPKFMAPEVILGKAGPDRESDKFSLAAIYFYLFLGHNPLEGKLRDDYVAKNGPLDPKSYNVIYGDNATFCFNEQDRRNRLDHDEIYKFIIKRWNCIIPPKLKRKFEKTFVTALSPDKRTGRTTDKEWISLFDDLKGSIHRCKCGNEYFEGAAQCYKCSAPLASASQSAPAPTPVQVAAPTPRVTGSKATALLSVREINVASPHTVELAANDVISGSDIGNSLSNHTSFARVLQSPDGNELGLKNMSTLEWYYKDPGSADLNTIAPGKIIALKSGRIIAFIKGTIQATVQ